MDNFQKSEQQGRSLLKEMLDQFGATDQQPTKLTYNPVDYYFTLKDYRIVAEIKVRDSKYENFDTHLMELSKFNALEQDKKDKELAAAIYVCFFGEDVCYWYSTNTIRKYAKQDIRYCNRTTAYNTGKQYKDILLIPKDKGTKFTKINGKWIKSN